jgi:hypothetical protein
LRLWVRAPRILIASCCAILSFLLCVFEWEIWVKRWGFNGGIGWGFQYKFDKLSRKLI